MTLPWGKTKTDQTAADIILRWGLIAFALPGFLSLRDSAPVVISTRLYAVVALVAVAVLFTQHTRPNHNHQRLATWYLFAGSYLGIKTTLMLLGPHLASQADFIQAYKAYIFLLPIIWFMGRDCFTASGIATTTRALLVLFTAKYSLSIAAGNLRPTVWSENNFELMTVIGLFYLSFTQLERNRTLWVGLLGAIVLMSGSRSSVFELCIVLLALYWKPSSPRFALYALPLMAAAWEGHRLVSERTGAGGLQSTDRYRFFTVFTHDASYWSPMEWLFGTLPLTPMSLDSCQNLAYYKDLFSEGSDSVCYSVILHSFALRAVFDQGVLGLIFLLVVILFALRRSGADLREQIALLGIGIANALSVSAFNSEYMFLVLAVSVGLARGAGIAHNPDQPIDLREPAKLDRRR